MFIYQSIHSFNSSFSFSV